MPGPAVIATHARAGRVEPTRVGVRIAEPTAEALRQTAPLAAQAPLSPGSQSVGPCVIDLAIESEGAIARVDVKLRNASSETLRLESAVLGFRWRCPFTAGLRFFQNGWQSWSFSGSRDLDSAGEPAFPSGPWLRGLHHAVSSPPADRGGWHESHMVAAVGAGAAGPVCCIGALERGESFGVVYLRAEASDVLVEVELHVDADLAPGEARTLERVRVALGDDASELLEAHAEEHGRLVGARASAPFAAGWCSWYRFFHDVSEADVLRNLEALAAARDELPVEVVQIDDGYQRSVGDWRETNARFPRGLGPLAEEVRAAGFTPGLWTAPFCVVPESELFRSHPDWLLRSGSDLHRGLLHPMWSKDAVVHVLDPTREAVAAHLESLFRHFVELGFGYLKLDFLYTVAMPADAADSGVGGAGRLRRGLEAIRRGAGDEAFLLGCGCPLGPAVGLVDGMRIGPDVAPAWRADAATAIPGIEETLPAARSAVRSILSRAWLHRRLWVNDPDCLVARSAADLTADEAHTLAAAIAATGGMTLFSDDVPELDSGRRALVGDTLRSARRVDRLGVPGVARALDLLDSEIPRRVVARVGPRAILAGFAAEDRPERIAFDLDRWGLLPLVEPPEPELASPAVEVSPGGEMAVDLAAHQAGLWSAERRAALAVFCDFDGTFSVQDVGATLAQRHAGERRPAVWARYERGELTAWQYNMEVLHGLALPRTEVERFLQSVDLMPGAPELVAWCEEHGVPFRVLSDGFDANLNRLQQIHGVRFAYEANELRYDRGRWRIAPGHPASDCGCGTGTCKRSRIEAYRASRPGTILVHIGNGRVSDLCGALAADHAFAKDSLALELEARGAPFEPFETLHDVMPRLEQLRAGEGQGA